MGVMVDKTTYERYQDLPEGDGRSLIQTHISINTVEPTDALYAKINPTPLNNCPFLTTDRLCGVQKEFGSKYLSATCSIYPRVLNSVNDELETSLYLSCPEAARLVLLNPNSTEVEGNVSSSHFRTDQFSRLAANDRDSIHKPYLYFFEIREFVITVIQNRSRPMWQRLFLLGMLCRDLDTITTTEQDSNVSRILSDYKEIIATGALHSEMEGVPAKPAEQVDLVLRLTDQCIRGGSSGERFQECFQQFIQGIGYSPESTPACTAQYYVKAEEAFCQPFFEQHPFIMENYLLNYVFRTLFPFGRARSAHYTPQGILGEYMMMAVQYALINGLLIGMAGHYQGDFGTEHVVKLIQSFSKAVEHNPTYLSEVKEFVKSRNLCTPEGIVILLKCSTVESCRLVAERRLIQTDYSTRPAIA
jgi:lysine-N-methylase